MGYTRQIKLSIMYYIFYSGQRGASYSPVWYVVGFDAVVGLGCIYW